MFAAYLGRGVPVLHWDNDSEVVSTLKLKNGRLVIRSPGTLASLMARDRCTVALSSVTQVVVGSSSSHIFSRLPSEICFHLVVKGAGDLDFALRNELECEMLTKGLQLLLQFQYGVTGPHKRVSQTSVATTASARTDDLPQDEAHFMKYISTSDDESDVVSPAIEDRERARQSFAGLMRTRSAPRTSMFATASVPEEDSSSSKRLSLPRKRSQREGFDS